MNLFKKFGITFGNKKSKLLPASTIVYPNNVIEPTIFQPTDNTAYKTLATFDINIEAPKYAGAIPEATVHFYPLN